MTKSLFVHDHFSDGDLVAEVNRLADANATQLRI
jgi:hypothetical protein